MPSLLSLVLSLAFFGNRYRVPVPLVGGGARVRTLQVTEPPTVMEDDHTNDDAPEVAPIADEELSTSSVTASPMLGSQAENPPNLSVSQAGKIELDQVFRP